MLFPHKDNFPLLQPFPFDCPRYTRDRKGGEVPTALEVVKVVEIQQPANYLNYICRRDAIFDNLQNSKSSRFKCYATDDNSGVKTFKAQPTWAAALGITQEPIDPLKNEYFLWHGTKPEAAEAITNSDFRVDLAGSHAGTLYGRGVYFAECCSKSDEYTEQDSRGLRPIILCRVTCGLINYTDEVHPNVDDLVRSCTRGEYHCVLGDREKCRNTFREFIVYDNDQAYPEYIVWYRRRQH